MKERRTEPDSEQAFLAAYDAGEFPRPSVAVDVCLLSVIDDTLVTATVRRAEHPHRGRHALPGGFVGFRESLDDAAARVLETKAGVAGVFLEQLYTFGEPGRDPRTRVISVTYYALLHPERFAAMGSEVDPFTVRVPWEGEAGGPVEIISASGETVPFAFDHAEIVGTAVKRIRGKLNYAPIAYALLPREFTLRRLQRVHETILGRRFNKDSFRRRLLATGELAPTGRREAEVGHRPAELYRHRAHRAR